MSDVGVANASWWRLVLFFGIVFISHLISSRPVMMSARRRKELLEKERTLKLFEEAYEREKASMPPPDLVVTEITENASGQKAFRRVNHGPLEEI